MNKSFYVEEKDRTLIDEFVKIHELKKKETKETLLEKIEKEIDGENRPDVIRDLENKMAILEEDEV